MARFDIPAGEYAVGDAHFAVVAARFNADIVDRLVGGVEATLGDHGVSAERLTLVRVPGAFEIPLTAKRLASRGRFAAIIALGAVIRGETSHFDYVAGECARGVAQVSLDTGVPIIFGVLTTDNRDQAEARAGGGHGNKGSEVALAALEMVTLLRRIDRQ